MTYGASQRHRNIWIEGPVVTAGAVSRIIGSKARAGPKHVRMARLVINPAIRVAQSFDCNQASFRDGGLCVVRQSDGKQRGSQIIYLRGDELETMVRPCRWFAADNAGPVSQSSTAFGAKQYIVISFYLSSPLRNRAHATVMEYMATWFDLLRRSERACSLTASNFDLHQ